MAQYGSSFYNSGIRYQTTSTQQYRSKRRTMAGNGVPMDPDDLLGLAEDIADGLQTVEVTVGVKQNTEAVIRGAITAHRNSDQALGIAKSAKGVARDGLDTADNDARVFLLAARKVLSLHLGDVEPGMRGNRLS
jgi:hypothetical protein